MNNTTQNEQIAIALYTINKYAKSIRDGRIFIKEFLWKNKGDINAIPQALCDYIDDNKIEECWYPLPNSRDHGIKALKDAEELSDLSKGEIDHLYEVELISAIDQSEDSKFEDYDIFSLMIEYRMEGIQDEDFNDSPEVLKILKRYKKDYEQIEETVDNCRTFYDELHTWLNVVSKVHKRFLYELKELVLKDLNLVPISYHQDSQGQLMLALYEFEGFKFHQPLTYAEIEKIKEGDETIVDEPLEELISAENMLTEDRKMTINEALTVLSEYLSISEYRELPSTQDCITEYERCENYKMYEKYELDDDDDYKLDDEEDYDFEEEDKIYF